MSSNNRNSAPAVVIPTSADLRSVISKKNPSGCDLLKAGAIIGKNQNAKVVIIHDSLFSSSNYGYSGTAVLVNTTFENIPPENRLVGRKSIDVEGNMFVVLKEQHTSPYLNLVP